MLDINLKKGDLVWIYNRYNPATLKYEPIAPAKALVIYRSTQQVDGKINIQFAFIDQEGHEATFWNFDRFRADFIRSTDLPFLGTLSEAKAAFDKGEFSQYYQ